MCVLLFSQVRLEWPTDLAVNPMDNSLYVLDNNIVLQISENRRVRIIAGRPIHCQVPGIDHFLVSKVAVHSTLESARAIGVSHSGLLFIAETDERRVNRIQQVTTNGEISIIAGAPTDCDCKIDPNCDCFSGMTFLAIHQLPLCFQKKTRIRRVKRKHRVLPVDPGISEWRKRWVGVTKPSVWSLVCNQPTK